MAEGRQVRAGDPLAILGPAAEAPPGNRAWHGHWQATTGHGKLRAGTRADIEGRPATRVVASHVYGHQLGRGPLQPDADGRLPVIRHTCDESSCHNPSHWITSTVRQNSADYAARAGGPGSPLTDRRGPADRARAIRNAILRALPDQADVEHAIMRAAVAGMPTAWQALKTRNWRSMGTVVVLTWPVAGSWSSFSRVFQKVTRVDFSPWRTCPPRSWIWPYLPNHGEVHPASCAASES